MTKHNLKQKIYEVLAKHDRLKGDNDDPSFTDNLLAEEILEVLMCEE